MSLVQDYSSDEEVDVSNDLFGLSSLPAAKKQRMEEHSSSSMVISKAAPAVLSEVRITAQLEQFIAYCSDRTPCIKRRL